jgi:hypothetical protein
MAVSETEICNIALRALREQPIASLTENSEPAQLCQQFYEQARDDLLERHWHNFAMRRQQLAQISQAADFEWEFAFGLPTDPYCLVARKLWADGRFREAWVVEGRRLRTCHGNDVWLQYTARVVDVTLYPATFVNALAMSLAETLCYPLSADKALREQIGKRAVDAFRTHKRVDAGTGQQPEFLEGAFVGSRF